MKLRNKILIIIISLFILYVNRETLSILYSNTVNFLADKIYTYEHTKDGSTLLNMEIDKLENIKTIDSSVSYSNPLKLLNSSSSSAKLSKENIINITNIERKDNGDLQAFTENANLDFTAEEKIDDIFTKQYFEHISPTGVGVSNLADDIYYKYILIGENLALGNFKNDQALVDAWMASPGHRANILNKNYTEIGVAVRNGMYKGRKVWVAVQHFAVPIDVCPVFNNLLKETIDNGKNKLNKLEAYLAIRKKSIDNRGVYDNLTIKEQIDKYNTLALEYNSLINKISFNISTYNKKAKAFNVCISKYTGDKATIEE